MPNKLRINSKILSLQDSNDVFMTLKMIVCTSDVNLNKARFTEDFITNYGSTLKDQPLTVDREELEAGNYDSLTHLFDPYSNELKTDPIGVIVETWSEKDDDGIFVLYATAKIWKRFPETCMAIMGLHSSENLRFSCEVLVEDEIKNNDGTYDITKGAFIGHAIVSFPAEVRAKSQLLVAEALNSDIKKEASNLSDEVKVEEVVETEEEIVEEKVEKSELSFEQITEMIWNKLNADDKYKYWIMRVYENYVIVQSNEDGKLYKLTYSIEESEIMLDMENMVEVMIEFVEMAEVKMFESEKYIKPDENITKLNELQEKYDSAIKANETFEVKVNELNDSIVSINEKIVEKDTIIEELNIFKVELEQIKESQIQEEVKAKQSKLSEMVAKTGLFTEEEVQIEIAELIESCNEIEIKAKIADKVIANLVEQEIEDVIIVNENVKGEQLIDEKDEITFKVMK